MFFTLSTLLLSLAVGIFYCTRKQQRLLVEPLNKRVRGVAVSLVITAIILTSQQFSNTATVFLVIFTLMMMLMLIPLLSLFYKKDNS